jgi:hypothetical protein
MMFFLCAVAGSPGRPQFSDSRSFFSLDGMWHVQADPAQRGIVDGWQKKLPSPTMGAPVPSTLNEVLGDTMTNFSNAYFGALWFERSVRVPLDWLSSSNVSLGLRFDAATANAQVWLNGLPICSHRGVGLPFGGTIDDAVKSGANRLTVRVDGNRNWQDLPPGASGLDEYGNPILYGGDASLLHPWARRLRMAHEDARYPRGLGRLLELAPPRIAPLHRVL